MNDIKITLLNHTPLWVCSNAIRTCYQSFEKGDKGGEKDKELIERVGNKMRHASTLEHLFYNFYIEGISRACLQELARHRIASLSVKSTRYTLKELRDESPFVPLHGICDKNSPSASLDELSALSAQGTGELLPHLPHTETKADFYGSDLAVRAKKYLVFTGESMVDTFSILALENLRKALAAGIKIDLAKYALPESYKTALSWSINARSLQNFLSLRSSASALWEIRNLANALFAALPDEHKYLFKDSMTES